jgi:hypothetical protein
VAVAHARAWEERERAAVARAEQALLQRARAGA